MDENTENLGIIETETVNVLNDTEETEGNVDYMKDATLSQKRLVWGYIVYRNLMENGGRIYSGKEKRRLRRECERNAAKGRYDKMFDEEYIKKRDERRKESFEKLNK